MAFSCEGKDDATLAFMRRSSVEVRLPILKVTMPLFAVEAGDGYLCATGVLLKVREKHFIVTAAHIFDNWETQPIPVYITDGVSGHATFGIGDVIICRSQTNNPHNRLIDDPADVCVCDISQETAEKIVTGNNFRFLELNELDPWDKEDPRSWYMVFGFPGELNQGEVAPNMLGSNACAYASFLYCGERGNHTVDQCRLWRRNPDWITGRVRRKRPRADR